MHSLEGRLQLGLALSLLLLIGGIWWLGQEALQRTADAFVLSRLQHDADALIAAFHSNRLGEPRVGQRHLTPVYNQPYSGHYFALETSDAKRLRSRSLWDWDLPVRPMAVGETSTWRTAGPSGQRLLVWGGGFSKGGHDFSLAVAEDVAPLDAELRSFQWWLAGIAAAALVLIILLQRFVVTQAFRRLQPVYRDMECLERGEAVTLTEAVPREILPLVRKLNRLLELFGQRLERSRNAAGNLAHALKGPMNLMQQRLNARNRPLYPETRQILEEQLARIQRLMERELKRARFAGAGAPGRQFDPAAELPTLVQLLQRMYPDKALEIELQLDTPAPLSADREDMLELLGNLLDNACKWADSKVLCRVAQIDGATVLTVEDDGPGCSDAELEAIGNRGVRLDESVSGHGLGLSIVKDIVGLYGGSIACGPSDALGGFRACVTLPLASPAIG